MAVQAPHGAALEKDNKTNPGTINGPEALCRMNLSPQAAVLSHFLHFLVEGPGDYLVLLLLSELIKVDSIA